MRTSHKVQVPQRSALKSAGVHADTVGSEGRCRALLSPSLNMHIDTRAHRLDFLRRSGFNEIAGAGVLEGSKRNVYFSASCGRLLTLTFNPLEQSPVPAHQLKVKANPTRGRAPELHLPRPAQFQQFTSSSLTHVIWREDLTCALQNNCLCLSYSVDF